MNIIGKYAGAQRSLDGDLMITFKINEDEILLEELEKVKEKDLSLDLEVLRKKRSLQANKFMWAICDQIAKAIGSDKDTIYLMKLQERGIFDYMEVIREALPIIRNLKDSKGRLVYRWIDEIDSFTSYAEDPEGNEREIEMVSIRCFYGSHGYTTKQMSDLIDAICDQASDLRIPTISAEELKRLAGC